MDTEPMSALPSSEFATSSAPLIRTSPKSKTSWPSATDGGAKRPWRRRLRLVRRLAHSLTLKLVLLIGVFIALPIVLYGQFESADTQRRELVSRGIQPRSWLIAQALTPLLDRPDGPPHKAMNQMLEIGRAPGRERGWQYV